MITWRSLLMTLMVTSTCLQAAPLVETTGSSDVSETKSNGPVEQLQQLKSGVTTKEAAPEIAHEHVEIHRLNSVQENGELVARVEQHATADAAPGVTPLLHAQTQVDVPSEGVHKVIVQEEEVKPSVVDATPAPSTDELASKVFHGAARLVKAGAGVNIGALPNGHTVSRRSFNADITKETQGNVDHYSSYQGVQYSPLDMAEYVFWTGDEQGVTAAIEQFLREEMMTKEEAIAFLQEIKFNIDYLRANYVQGLKAAEESSQQEALRGMLAAQANKFQEHQSRNPASVLQSFPFGSSADIIQTIASQNYEVNNNLNPYSLNSPYQLPVSSAIRHVNMPAKRAYDPTIQSNVIDSSLEDLPEAPFVTQEEYEEILAKMKASAPIYTENALENIIFQLARMMFTQTLSRDPSSLRANTQRFLGFLEVEADRGKISRVIQKTIVDLMLLALQQTFEENPELVSEQKYAPKTYPREYLTVLDAGVSQTGPVRDVTGLYKQNPVYKNSAILHGMP